MKPVLFVWWSLANELKISASFKWDDGLSTPQSATFDFTQSITTKRPHHTVQAVGTTEEAIGLGDLTTFSWGIFANLDPTNFIELRLPGTGAANDSVKLPARDGNNKPSFAIFYFGSNLTAPYAIADTAACNLEYWLFPT